jgi:hypothetical protein
MEEAAEEGRELYRDELHDLHSLRSIVTVIKSMRINGQGMWHVWEENRN